MHQRCPDFLLAALATTRMRFSLKESRMKLLNVTNLDRKSGIRGSKTMGEAHHSFLFPTLLFVYQDISEAIEGSAVHRYFLEMFPSTNHLIVAFKDDLFSFPPQALQ